MAFPGTSIFHLIAGGLYRLLGGFQPEKENQGQSNDVHRSSINFDGSTEYLENSTLQDVGIGNEWSIVAWYRSGNGGGNNRIISISEGTSTSNNQIQLDVDGTLGGNPFRVIVFDQDFDSNGNHKDYRWSRYGTTNDVWRMAGLTWDGSNLTVFDDGDEQTPTKDDDLSVSQNQTDRFVTIGTRDDHAAHFFQGHLHSIAIWNAALTGDEIATVFNQGDASSFNMNLNQGSYQSAGSLVHWWRLGYDASNIGKDYAADSTYHIDVDTNAANISTADIERDAPDAAIIDFNGSNEYLRNSTTQAYGIANSFSTAVWLKLDSWALQDCVFHFVNPSPIGSQILFRENGGGGKIRFLHTDSSNNSHATDSTTDAPIGTWTHVVFTKEDTTETRIYINGKQDASSTTGLRTTTDADRRGIIMAFDDVGTGVSSHADGQVYSVQVWDSVLSADEVAFLFNGGHKDIDVQNNAGAYKSAANLKHNWRIGDVGESGETGNAFVVDDVESGGIDISANSTHISRSDPSDAFSSVSVGDGVSLELSGSAEYLRRSTSNTYGVANSYTVSVWFRADVTTATQIIADWNDASAVNQSRILLWINGSSQITAFVSDASTNSATASDSSTASTGVWIHAVLVKDGTTALRLYLDGQEAASDTTSVPTTADDSRVAAFGADARSPGTGGTAYFNGRIGHVVMWDAALSAVEISQIYSMGHSFSPEKNVGAYSSSNNVVHWWKPGEDPDSMGRDYVGEITLDAENNISHEANVRGDGP